MIYDILKIRRKRLMELPNQWMNDKADCRTAPATPGLLIIGGADTHTENTDRHKHQYHDSARPKGRAEWKEDDVDRDIWTKPPLDIKKNTYLLTERVTCNWTFLSITFMPKRHICAYHFQLYKNLATAKCGQNETIKVQFIIIKLNFCYLS